MSTAHPDVEADAWQRGEIEYLVKLGSRRTGSFNHNHLIDRIQSQLELLGLRVFTDTLTFDYDELPSLRPASLSINGQDIPVSSTVPYSGHTPEGGISCPLVNLNIHSQTEAPEWSRAAGSIAVVNIVNPQFDRSRSLPLWPGSTPWDPPSTGIPSTIANTFVANLDCARDAGVRAIIYTWENISDLLARGLYAPFHNPWFGIPALFVVGRSASAVREAASSNSTARLTLMGHLVPDTPTRNIWTVIPGTERPQESIIINTHTDGTNVVEENGHIALLQYAQSLVRSPPRRTTILAFITAHIHAAPFSTTKRSTTRWLADNPRLWSGSWPDGYRAVFATCVEHLGAVAYREDLAANTYLSTHQPEEELLYAATPELASLLYQHWVGAYPNLIRIINPNVGPQPQFGEGLPLYHAGIPEISLITAPTWLLNEFPKEFDERDLVDTEVLKRQVDSFVRIWRIVDSMDAALFGAISP